MPLELVQSDFKARRLQHGDMTITYGVWMLARYFQEKNLIFVIASDAPKEMIDMAVAILKEKFPQWQSCTWDPGYISK